MQLKAGTYIDARRKGSIFRFINHSCQPNCTVEMWTVGRRTRVGVFTTKDISSGEELCFDYKWKRSSRAPTKCHCGTSVCRGYLEVISSEELALVWYYLNSIELLIVTHHSPYVLVFAQKGALEASVRGPHS